MGNTYLNEGVEFFNSIPFTGATWFVLFILAFIVWMFAKANKDPSNPVRWEHLIIDSSNNRASPYKTGFLVGMIVSTWVILTYVDKNILTFDIFGLYLTYLLGGAGWNSMLKSKQSSSSISETNLDSKDDSK